MVVFHVLLRGPGPDGKEMIRTEFEGSSPPSMTDLKRLVKKDSNIDVGHLNHLVTNADGSSLCEKKNFRWNHRRDSRQLTVGTNHDQHVRHERHWQSIVSDFKKNRRWRLDTKTKNLVAQAARIIGLTKKSQQWSTHDQVHQLVSIWKLVVRDDHLPYISTALMEALGRAMAKGEFLVPKLAACVVVGMR